MGLADDVGMRYAHLRRIVIDGDDCGGHFGFEEYSYGKNLISFVQQLGDSRENFTKTLLEIRRKKFHRHIDGKKTTSSTCTQYL